MLDINRWDPFQEMVSLREAMNRLMEDSFLLPSRTIGNSSQEGTQLATRGNRQMGAPAVDIQEQDDAYMLRVALPGVRPDDVRIETRGNQVIINGQVREEQERERGNYLLRERRVGQFYRAFTLPNEVNPEGAEATYANGILTLKLPKNEATRSRQIPIRAGEQRLESGQTQMPGQGQGQGQIQGQGQRQGQASWGQGQPPQQGQGQGQSQMPGQGQSQIPGQGQQSQSQQGQGQGRPQQQ